MRISLLLLICSTCIIGTVRNSMTKMKSATPSEAETQAPNYLYLADPSVFRYKGFYYIYGTDDLAPDAGIPAYRSKDLVHWEGPIGKHGGYALLKGDAFGDRGFWAPYVLAKDNKFYMFYTANEQIAVATNDFRNKDYSVGYATSKSPTGPWTKFAGNPILKQDGIIQGPGSCDLIKTEKGEWFLFYHVHNTSQDWRPRKIAFSNCRFVPQPGGNPPKLEIETERHFAYRSGVR